MTVPVFYSNSPAQTINMGKDLGALLRGGDVVLLSGNLGAGKTQFAKGVALGLSIADDVTSPTFNLVLEYPTEDRRGAVGGEGQASSPPPSQKEVDCAKTTLLSSPHYGTPALLRHFDLYRLETACELDDIDYFGLLEDERAASLIEWGNKFLDALPQQYLEILLTDKGDDIRELSMAAVGKRAGELLHEYADKLAGKCNNELTGNLADDYAGKYPDKLHTSELADA